MKFRTSPPYLFSFELFLVECVVIVMVFIILITVGYGSRFISRSGWTIYTRVSGSDIKFNFKPELDGFTKLVILNNLDNSLVFESSPFKRGTTSYIWRGTLGNYRIFLEQEKIKVSKSVYVNNLPLTTSP